MEGEAWCGDVYLSLISIGVVNVCGIKQCLITECTHLIDIDKASPEPTLDMSTCPKTCTVDLQGSRCVDDKTHL